VDRVGRAGAHLVGTVLAEPGHQQVRRDEAAPQGRHAADAEQIDEGLAAPAVQHLQVLVPLLRERHAVALTPLREEAGRRGAGEHERAGLARSSFAAKRSMSPATMV